MNSRRWYLIDRRRYGIQCRGGTVNKWEECIGHRVERDRPSWIVLDDEDEID